MFDNGVLKEVENYRYLIRKIESNFNGLPYASRNLVNNLISKIDLISGLVDSFTYRDLATLLTDNCPNFFIVKP